MIPEAPCRCCLLMTTLQKLEMALIKMKRSCWLQQSKQSKGRAPTHMAEASLCN